MTGTLAELRDMVNQQRTIKDWYSPEEVADMQLYWKTPLHRPGVVPLGANQRPQATNGARRGEGMGNLTR
jgi:hypothetical protein